MQVVSNEIVNQMRFYKTLYPDKLIRTVFKTFQTILFEVLLWQIYDIILQILQFMGNSCFLSIKAILLKQMQDFNSDF